MSKQRTHQEGEPWCCRIGCDAAAEWEIRHGDGPDDYTHSCTACVGELLSDAPEHRIYPLAAHLSG